MAAISTLTASTCIYLCHIYCQNRVRLFIKFHRSMHTAASRQQDCFDFPEILPWMTGRSTYPTAMSRQAVLNLYAGNSFCVLMVQAISSQELQQTVIVCTFYPQSLIIALVSALDPEDRNKATLSRHTRRLCNLTILQFSKSIRC